MKKIICFALLCALLFSCNKEDEKFKVEGVWKLTSFTTAPIDLNNNGTATTDFKAESGCFNNSTITLAAGGSAIISLEEIDINLDVAGSNYSYSTECLPANPLPGLWTQVGNVITVDGEQLTLIGNTLSVTIPEFTEYPVQSLGVISYTTSPATLVFTKQ